MNVGGSHLCVINIILTDWYVLQLAQAEKEEILLFESHLAAATTKVTITESNSLLLSQLISMDPV